MRYLATAMRSVFCTSFESIIGPISVASTEDGVCKISLGNNARRDCSEWIERNLPGFTIYESGTNNRQVIGELKEYFERRLVRFQSRYLLVGTEFQKRVWSELRTLAFGTVITYKELAQRVGTPSGFQAVGRANAVNPLPILVPCHRVIGSRSNLAGYVGGVRMKEFLLRLEGVLIV